MASSTPYSVCATPEGWDKVAPVFNATLRTVFAANYSHPGAIGLFDTVVPDTSLLPDNVKILDVAGGAGALSLYAAKKIQEKNGTVLGTDFSPMMVAALKENVASLNLSNVQAEVMDGQNLTVPDNSFDYIFSVWGLIFFPDIAKGFSEMHRVVKEGGKVGIATWTANNAQYEIAQEIARREKIDFPTPPFLRLGTEQHLYDAMLKAGFKDIVVKALPVEFNMPNHELFVTSMGTNPGTIDTRNALGLDQETFERLFVVILKEKYPEVPAKMIQTALVAYATK